MKKTKLPRDLNQIAKIIADIATEEIVVPPPEQENQNAQNGRTGGLIGGPARAAKLNEEERKEISRKASCKRWQEKK